MRKFPRTVQLHRQYAAEGLVMMSLDRYQEEWEVKEKVLKFLTDQDAKFPNYIFRDRPTRVEDWLDAHGVIGTPALIAFDRTGKKVKVPDLKTEADEEAFVKGLLAR